MTEEAKPAVHVSIANALNRAVHSLSVIERRVVMLAISKLGDNEYTGNPRIKVTAVELAKHGGTTPDAAYKAAKSVYESLDSKRIRTLTHLVTKKPVQGKVHWTSSTYYSEGEGYIELGINSDLLPYISDLKREFTAYDRARTGSFKSMYSVRLFDLLMQYKTIGSLRIKTAELADLLEVPDSFRANFANFRKRAIEAAINEIREKDGLKVKWKPLTVERRKIVSLEFTFPVEQQKEMPLDKPKKKATGNKRINKAYIEQHARPGETYEIARARLESELRRKTAA